MRGETSGLTIPLAHAQDGSQNDQNGSQHAQNGSQHSVSRLNTLFGVVETYFGVLSPKKNSTSIACVRTFEE